MSAADCATVSEKGEQSFGETTRMRILMACAAFPPFMDGGGPVSAMMVARLLQRAGHEVLVVNVEDEDRYEVEGGVPVHRLPSLNIYWNYRVPRPGWKKVVWHLLENFNPRAYIAMQREIARFRPDLVLTDSIENINVATWGAAKAAGVPVCHIVRSHFLLCWKGSMMTGGDACAGQCASCRVTSVGKRFMSRYVDGVIGETDFVLGRHRDNGYFPRAVFRRIPGAIEAVHAAAPRPAPVGRPLRVGFIGVHTRLKGLDTLAEAARMFAPGVPVEFVIAGSGDDAFARETRARFPDWNTRFLGWTTPEAFFPGIDVLVVPSRGPEVFGRVSIEAFAYGVPVIGARSGGIPEVIGPDSGFTFPPGDVEALAVILRRLIEAPAMVATLSAGALAAAQAYLAPRIGAEFSRMLDEVRVRGAARPAAAILPGAA